MVAVVRTLLLQIGAHVCADVSLLHSVLVVALPGHLASIDALGLVFVHLGYQLFYVRDEHAA